MPEATDRDGWFEGELEDVLDCLRIDLLQAVLDLLRGELSLRRIGLEGRIGTGAAPAVFVAPSLDFRSSQVIERRSVRSWLVRFLRGSSVNRYAALRVRANLAAAPGEPPAEEDLAFQIRQPSFITHRSDRVAEIQLASGQRLTVTELSSDDGRYTWKLDSVEVRKGLPMEGVALLTETLIRWRTGQDDRDLRTIRASEFATGGTPLAALLHLFASGISDIGAMLRHAHSAGAGGALPPDTTSGSGQVRDRVGRWEKSHREFIKELKRIEKDWHPDLGCRFQFRDWRSRMLVDLDRSLAPVERGGDGERLQVDFEAARRAGGPIRLSYFLPDVLADGDFLRSVVAAVMNAVDDIDNFPTAGIRREHFEEFCREFMDHLDAGRVRLLRIEIAPAENDDGTTTDTDILVVNRDSGDSSLRQVMLRLELRTDHHPELALKRIDTIRLLGFLLVEPDGERKFRIMKNGSARPSNFVKGFGRRFVFDKDDEIHRYFARLVKVMNSWEQLIGRPETM